MSKQHIVRAALLVAAGTAGHAALGQSLADLRINELVVTPTDGEFVEIVNTGPATLDLGDVYLTDATFAGGAVFYYNIVTGDLNLAGGGGFGDWHARFPSGASIAPGEIQTVALGSGAAGFAATYDGALPTYELCDTDSAVPDMREALEGAVNCGANDPGLSNGGEFAVLYAWDGQSDLVQDIDYVVWGDKAEAVDKTGVAIDGPDADGDNSVYQPDTGISAQAIIAPGAHAAGDSFSREDPAEGTETQTGGNGVDGADETSEDLDATFCEGTATPGTANACAPPPAPADLVINEFQYDPDPDIAGDANGDGIREGSEDEFVELVNTGVTPIDLSGWTLADGFDVRHVFAPGTVLAADCGIVVFGGGAPSGDFGGFEVVTASTGLLGLNNGGDSILIADAGGSTVAALSYDGALAEDQSATRDPDLTGEFVAHSTATVAGGALYSPGTRVDGSVFAGCGGPLFTPIHAIQGAQHRSPLEGQIVSVEAVVTAVTPDGFYLQEEDADADADIATSEGMFVFTGGTPTVAAGDLVRITDEVEEFRPGDNRTTITEFVFPDVAVVSSGNPLPTPVVLGVDRIQPTAIIDNDSVETIDIEIEGTFDASEDGIDFYESLEGMLVQANDLVVSGGTTVFGSPTPGNAEVYTLVDNGAGAGPRTRNGGIYVRPDDFNPENLILNNEIVQVPLEADTGDLIPGTVTGVITANFGKYFLQPTFIPEVIDGGLTPESTGLLGDADTLTVASYNVENLDPEDTDGDQDLANGRFDAIAATIVGNLGAPDIIGLQEIQDGSGSINDGTVSADRTAAVLIEAIVAAGGPAYAYAEVVPFDLDNGGQPGGNIRTAFLYDPARVDFVRRGDAGAADAVDAVAGPGVPDLTLSPGLIDPGQFVDSRKPTVGEFLFNGQTVYVVTNHFNSKSGDTGLFDILQPPVVFSEEERLVQASAVAGFVSDLLALDPAAKLVVLGDLNDFEFSAPVQVLVDAGLTNLVETIPAAERYSFVFNGNSQVLDHVLVSGALAGASALDMVHVHADFAETEGRASDHDPLLAALTLPPAIDETLAYFDDSVRVGAIFGRGQKPEQRRARLVTVRRLLRVAGVRLETGASSACPVLAAARKLADGDAPDAIGGDGLPELLQRLDSLARGAGCS